jgi:hypothetical protein
VNDESANCANKLAFDKSDKSRKNGNALLNKEQNMLINLNVFIKIDLLIVIYL